ncbi:MAG: CvpA family protein [Chloroflexi bacterium]|nr:CvpA family protein [Chloroflexota bacterium]
MNWIDIVILIIIGVTTFSGLRIGIIKAALSLAGLIAGVILAGRYYIPLAERLSFIPQDSVAKAVALAIILIGVMLVASIAAMLLKLAVSAVMLGWVNHLGGAAFGLVLGAIFCGALLATGAKFLSLSGVISRSSLATILLDRFPAVLALLPDEFDMIRSFFK